MKKILLLIAFCISLVGCASLPPIGSTYYSKDGKHLYTRYTELTYKDVDILSNKTTYYSYIDFYEDKFGGHPLIIFPEYTPNKNKSVIFPIHSSDKRFIYSLIFENSTDKVILNTAGYSKDRIERQEIYAYYDLQRYNYDRGNTIFYTHISVLEKLLVMLKSEEKIKIILDCYQGKIPHKISEKSKKELIVFIETLIEIESQKGSA